MAAKKGTMTKSKSAKNAAQEPASAADPLHVTAYKAFNPDWTCRDTKYEIGKTYVIDGAPKLCEHGFHACKIPFDCWNYYAGSTTFARVSVENPIGHTTANEDSKIVSAKMTIEVSLALPEWIKAQVTTIIDLCRAATGMLAAKEKECAAATGDSGHAAATGDRGHAAATGDRGHAAATGYRGHAAATGDRGHAAATGDSGHAAATGDSGHAAATGYRGHAAATGYSGHAAATGYRGHAAATGDSGHAAATGKNSIAVSLGRDSTAKGADGTWLVLAQYEPNYPWNLIAVKTAKVGENGIKPNATYQLSEAGEFVEVAL